MILTTNACDFLSLWFIVNSYCLIIIRIKLGVKKLMKKWDTYLSLCTEVYDLSKPNAPEYAYRFYRSYALEAQGPILEPMCGTGNFLLPLLEEGFDVHGVDASEFMLNTLHAKANAKKLNHNVWQGLVADSHSSEKYKLIFIPSGSFGLITEIEAIKNALKNLYHQLEHNGLFVFEVETLRAVPNELGIWSGYQWRRADDKIILLSQLATLEGAMCYSIGKYELVDANRVVQTEVEEYKISIYDDSSFLHELLRAVGFREVRLVKAFDRLTSPGQKDDSIVYECKK